MTAAILLFRDSPADALDHGVTDQGGAALKFPCPPIAETIALKVGSLAPLVDGTSSTQWASARLCHLLLQEIPRDSNACPPVELDKGQRRRRIDQARVALTGLGVLPGSSHFESRNYVNAYASDLVVRGYGLDDEAAEDLLLAVGLVFDEGSRSPGRFFSPDQHGPALDQAATQKARDDAQAVELEAKAKAAATRTTPTTPDSLGITLYRRWENPDALHEGSRPGFPGKVARMLPQSALICRRGDRALFATKTLGLKLDAGPVVHANGGIALEILPGDEALDLTDAERDLARNAPVFSGRLPRNSTGPVATWIEPATDTYKAAIRRARELTALLLPACLHVDHESPPLPLIPMLVRGLTLEPAVVAKIVNEAAKKITGYGLFLSMYQSTSEVMFIADAAATTGLVREGELLAGLDTEATAEVKEDVALETVRAFVIGKDSVRSEDVLVILGENSNPGPVVKKRVAEILEHLGFFESKESIGDGKKRRVYRRTKDQKAARSTAPVDYPEGTAVVT